jgi:c-di-GMP-binding flagellar brake protein YcgR
MTSLDRRFDHRIPLELYLDAYVDDRRQRGFTVNLSETGLYLNTLPGNLMPPLTTVGLELALPGLPETLWVAGEICRDDLDDYFYGRGIKFTAMASRHARMLREYCYKLRRRQARLRS